MSEISRLIKPIIRLIISLVVLGIINYILTRLPGVNSAIPGMPISTSSIISAIIAMVMIVVVLHFGNEFSPLLLRVYPNYPEFKIIAKNAIILIAISIAYSSFSGLITPFLFGEPWLYHIIFLLIAIIPAYTLAITLYKNIDKWTGQIHNEYKVAAGELTTCKSCRTKFDIRKNFCPNCGAPNSDNEDASQICYSCGEAFAGNEKFCPNCGTQKNLSKTVSPQKIPKNPVTICKGCGAEVVTGSNKCDNCGRIVLQTFNRKAQ